MNKDSSRLLQGLRDRIRGCILGGGIGDALGAPVEFLSRAEILRQFGPAGIVDFAPAYGEPVAITDDTQMALFCAEGMIRANVRAALRGLPPVFTSVTAHAYLRWLLTQGIRSEALLDGPTGWLLGESRLHARRAPGRTCLSSLQSLTDLSQRAVNDSKGCGAVMRVAPIGVFFGNVATRELVPEDFDLDREVFELGRADAAITHGHSTGQLAAGFLALLIARLVRGDDIGVGIDAGRRQLLGRTKHRETLQAIDKACEVCERSPADPEVLAALGQGWVAEEALAISLYCAMSAPDAEHSLLLAVNHGGDSDSTGAITGNIVGARYGIQVFPERWLEQVELGDVLLSMADDLFEFPRWDLEDEAIEEQISKRYPGF